MQIQIRFHRPYDRDPDDHLYGEPFDSALDELVGGKDSWSSLKEQRDEQPSADLSELPGSVELHEDGALLNFVVQNADQIPNYVSALSAVVSAWAATRALKRDKLPKDDLSRKSGYVIRIDDVEIKMQREPTVEEMSDLISIMVKHKEKHPARDD